MNFRWIFVDVTESTANVNYNYKYPDIKVGFSKFAYLLPPHCVLADASGTQSVCVCTIYQNVKLLFQTSKLGDLMPLMVVCKFITLSCTSSL